MPKRPSYKERGAKLYNKILSEFTKINKLLPDERKVALDERRKVISAVIYPYINALPKSKITIKGIVKKIKTEVGKLPPKEIANLTYLNPSIYATVDWFAIDDFIQSVAPKGIYIRVSAAEYGITRIFNTKNYAYYKSQVINIRENLREPAKDNSELEFAGFRKLRPRKKNDGEADSYFLDMILFINGTALGDASAVKFKISKKKKKIAQKIEKIISERISQLDKKKKRSRRARKTFRQKVDKIKVLKSKSKKAKLKSTKKRIDTQKLKEFNAAMLRLDKDYQNGLLTSEEYKKFKRMLYTNFAKGGKI